ncbi:hypothetical protein P7D22_16995 [Lichenihabitans sp. Uapishka_5]|uniref:hypothetical protein n=1 Tax=Lichenihabitans sp. Uapishka_5 TaxID=3037302 RepID=UPI0029E824E3|nr:hypothetical protein [Lichenihabitans sp. Uapishka_5]MDX7952866.1 hypothetical protein [Lichenihabitans sp. Uapishka_5]
MSFNIETVAGNFVGDFKVGDNLVYNTQLLCDLVQANEAGRFNKPIVLQVGAILEAALSEIIYRAQKNNREGVPDMSEADRREIEGKKIDKFNSVIDVMRKYRVLDRLGGGVYGDLHTLRRYRNKVHIQDDVEGASRDEAEVFVDALRDWALDLNSRVLRYLGENLMRPPHIRRYVADLPIPVRANRA